MLRLLVAVSITEAVVIAIMVVVRMNRKTEDVRIEAKEEARKEEEKRVEAKENLDTGNIFHDVNAGLDLLQNNRKKR